MRARTATRSILVTFGTAVAVYTVNHATELHIPPWLAALISGLAATASALSSQNEEKR